jgi:hypothetical protein
MATAETDSVIPPEILADLGEVARQAASGGVRAPELLRRVTERADQARQQTLEMFGVQDIGVPIIREMRDAE